MWHRAQRRGLRGAVAIVASVRLVEPIRPFLVLAHHANDAEFPHRPDRLRRSGEQQLAQRGHRATEAELLEQSQRLRVYVEEAIEGEERFLLWSEAELVGHDFFSVSATSATIRSWSLEARASASANASRHDAPSPLLIKNSPPSAR